MKCSILVVDDEPSIRSSLERVLVDQGYQVATAATLAEGRGQLATFHPDIVIIDLKLPDGNGVDLLGEISALAASVEIIVITAYGDVESAVAAMKAGAGDFLKKPYNMDEMLLAVRAVSDKVDRERQLDGYRRRALETFRSDQMIGRCAAMKAISGLIDKVSASDATTVLIEGESGTGKELAARSIHFRSARAPYPLMEINCSSFQEGLLENELFGHERGAFTDAHAMKKGLVEVCDQGTLFLDEVAEMPPGVQAKLLRFIDQKSFKRVGGTQEIAVDIRIIAATNKRLADCVADGAFREDLYYRLKVVSIEMPPLRDRGDDVLLLAEHFMHALSRKFRKRFACLSPDVGKLLRAHAWPGNVRELRNMIERVVLLENAEEIRPRMLPQEIVMSADSAAERMLTLAQVEENYIARVLDATGLNKSRAARVLGISRQCLLDRLKRYQARAEEVAAESRESVTVS